MRREAIVTRRLLGTIPLWVVRIVYASGTHGSAALLIGLDAMLAYLSFRATRHAERDIDGFGAATSPTKFLYVPALTASAFVFGDVLRLLRETTR